jgi:hypothetical protein
MELGRLAAVFDLGREDGLSINFSCGAPCLEM